MAKLGRPKGSRNGRRKRKSARGVRGLRFKYYDRMPSSEGGTVSGFSDQYGRIMNIVYNEEGDIDVTPSRHCIAARH